VDSPLFRGQPLTKRLLALLLCTNHPWPRPNDFAVSSHAPQWDQLSLRLRVRQVEHICPPFFFSPLLTFTWQVSGSRVSDPLGTQGGPPVVVFHGARVPHGLDGVIKHYSLTSVRLLLPAGLGKAASRYSEGWPRPRRAGC
jgi:hypothetical protein